MPSASSRSSSASTTCTSRVTSPSSRSSPSTPPTSDLFSADRVAALRELASPHRVEEARGLRYLPSSRSTGCVGALTKAEAAGARRGSRRRSRSSPAVGRSRTAQAAVEQANEADPERREALEEPQDAGWSSRRSHRCLTARRSSARTRSAASWAGPSYADAYAELRGLDLARAASTGRASFSTRPRRPTRQALDPRLDALGTAPARRAAPLGSAALLSRRRPRRGIRRRASASRVRGHPGRARDRPPRAAQRPPRRRVRGRRSRRAPSAPRCGCPTRSTS